MATSAFANNKPALEKELQMVTTFDMIEVEPNDTCEDATYNYNIIADDDSYSSEITTGEDVDYYEVFVVTDGEYHFETYPGDVVDTKMYLYADDCSTQLYYNDDGGAGYYSAFDAELVAGTMYYLKVIPYSSSYTGTYILTMDANEVIPAPENDTCETALPLPMGTTFMTTTCGATNDYNAGGTEGCTGYSSNGLDIVYSVELIENQELTVTVATSYDNAIYLVSDCGDVFASCVAGSDSDVSNHVETLVFDTAMAPGTYYLIIDGFSSTPCGDTEITVGGVVPAETTSWDNVKSMYR